MALAAKLYRLDNRQSDRFAVEVDATVRAASAQPIDATVSDLSETGFCAAIGEQLSIGAEISIGLAGVGVIEACVVRRDADGRYGCRFLVPLSPAALARTGSVETIVTAFPIAPDDFKLERIAAAPEIRGDKLPGWMSIGIILGSSALLWTGIVAGVRTAIA